MDRSSPRRRWLALGIPVVAVVLVAGSWWFRPDALFVDRTVDEDLDADLAALLSSPSPNPSTSRLPTTSPSATAIADPTPGSSSDPTSGPASRPDAPSTVPPTSGASTTAPTTAPTSVPTPEPGPAGSGPSGPVVLARGDWTSLEHDTSGTVALVDDGGDLQVVLADLDTSNGPDLRVILSPKEGVTGDWFGYEEDATYLGALRGNRGTQSYDVPDDLDLDDVASVVIWCERFAVGFGAANLG